MKYRNSQIFYFFAQNDENLLHENCLLVILYTVNIWCAFDMNENIVTGKFLANTKIFQTKLMRIMVGIICLIKLYQGTSHECI